MLPFFGFIVGIFSSWEESGRECISILSWFLVNNENGLGSYHQDSNLSFLDSGQEFHVNQLSLLSNDVFVTEVHEFTKLSVLNMIVDSFSALDFSIERKTISWLVLSLIFNNYSPDTFTSWSSILFKHSLALW